LRIATSPPTTAPSKKEDHTVRDILIIVVLILVVIPLLVVGTGFLAGFYSSTFVTSSVTTSTSTNFGTPTATLAENGNPIAVITASVVAHLDGTATFSINVTNVSTNTIHVSQILLNDGYVDLVNTYPTANQNSISPTSTYSFSTTLYGNQIIAGQGYFLAVTILVNLSGDVQLVKFTVDAKSG
jgi:hypothetical protein